MLKKLRERIQQRMERRVRQTPTILQMEVTECGVASLAMVLAYYGRWISLEELRVTCGVSRDGCRADTLIRAARRYELACNAFRAEPEQLARVPMPCILHWEFNHFVVLEGLTKRHAYLNDPAVGRRRITWAELSAGFTGVVLAMRPKRGFSRGGAKPALLRFLVQQLQHSKAAVAILMMISLALVIPGLMIPAFSRIFVDDILVAGNQNWLRPFLLGIAATALLRSLCMTVQQSLSLRLQGKLAVTMMSRVVWHVLSLPLEFFTQRQAGDIANRISGGEQVSRLLANGLAVNALSLVETGFFALLMAAYDLPLAGLCLSIVCLNVVATVLLGGRHEDVNRSLSSERGTLVGTTLRQISGIEGLKANGLEGYFFGGWAGYQAKYLNKYHEAGLYAVVMQMMPVFTSAMATAAILGFGSWQIIHGSLTIGALVAFQSLTMSFAAPITNLVQLTASMQAAKGDIARLLDVFNYPAEPVEHPPLEAQAGTKLSGRIKIRDLRFGYSPLAAPLVDGLSLELQPGMRVALVGASGSGKSTVSRLISGLYRPWGGQIWFDGRPRDQIPAEVFAASLAYVDQEISLFDASLRDNLTLWDRSITDETIHRALRDAEIDHVIALRPGHFDCRVEQGGRNFSGGERQRIEIARALVGEPSILLLDEATAALDSVTEQAIDANLRRRGCSCILIAHRLSTIRDCDEIIVLDKGKVIERGTHDDLMSSRGVYAGLIARE
jgi:NHLM bacteriocin system ABC transporter peptidase/ATP-binding protein